MWLEYCKTIDNKMDSTMVATGTNKENQGDTTNPMATKKDPLTAKDVSRRALDPIKENIELANYSQTTKDVGSRKLERKPSKMEMKMAELSERSDNNRQQIEQFGDFMKGIRNEVEANADRNMSGKWKVSVIDALVQSQQQNAELTQMVTDLQNYRDELLSVIESLVTEKDYDCSDFSDLYCVDVKTNQTTPKSPISRALASDLETKAMKNKIEQLEKRLAEKEAESAALKKSGCCSCWW